VASPNAEHGSTAVEVEEVIVCIGYVEAACILGLVVVGMADERAFPVVVQVAVGDCDEVLRVCESALVQYNVFLEDLTHRRSSHVDEPVVEVFGMRPVVT